MGFESAELRKFTDAGRAIAQATGATLEQWAEGEMGIILKGTAAMIGAATVPAAEKRSRNRALQDLGLTRGNLTINSGVRGEEGRVWIRAKNGKFMFAGRVGHNAGAFAPNATRHFADTQWSSGKEGVTAFQGKAGIIAMAKRTVGLARQSVLQMGDAIGIALERVAGGDGLSGADLATARNAAASDGKTYQNGSGSRMSSEGAFSIEVVNSYPNLHAAKIDTALAASVGQRVAYASRTLTDKLLASSERVARAFPYLQIER